MKTVMCRECKQRFEKKPDGENVTWIMPSKNWYYHKDCYQKWIEKRLNKKNVEEKKKDDEYRVEIFDYLQRDLKVNFNGAKVGTQIRAFLNQGMTLKGILFCLIYCYEIKKLDWDKSSDGIGIIPYVYEESKNYWQNMVNRQANILQEYETQIKTRRDREKIVIKKKENKKWKNHLEEIGALDE